MSIWASIWGPIWAPIWAGSTEPETPTEPVTVAEAKRNARIDHDDLDDDIALWITTAREEAEHETGRCYVRQTKRSTFTCWPSRTERLPVVEAVSVAISYWDGSAWVDMDEADFVAFDFDGTATGVAPALTTTWPTLGEVAGGARVRIDVTAGPEDPTTATASVKSFIKATVAWWIDNPSAADAGAVPKRLLGLLDRQRVWGA